MILWGFLYQVNSKPFSEIKLEAYDSSSMPDTWSQTALHRAEGGD